MSPLVGPLRYVAVLASGIVAGGQVFALAVVSRAARRKPAALATVAGIIVLGRTSAAPRRRWDRAHAARTLCGLGTFASYIVLAAY
jgi:hypothetical protein